MASGLALLLAKEYLDVSWIKAKGGIVINQDRLPREGGKVTPTKSGEHREYK